MVPELLGNLRDTGWLSLPFCMTAGVYKYSCLPHVEGAFVPDTIGVRKTRKNMHTHESRGHQACVHTWTEKHAPSQLRATHTAQCMSACTQVHAFTHSSAHACTHMQDQTNPYTHPGICLPKPNKCLYTQTRMCIHRHACTRMAAQGHPCQEKSVFPSILQAAAAGRRTQPILPLS